MFLHRPSCALRPGSETRAPGERYQVVVHVDAAVLADPEQPGQSVLEDGPRVPAETSRLACDASRVVMRHDADGHITEVGAPTRTIPPALRRALHARDCGCRFPGCGLPFGQGHHVQHWAHGGPTTLSNLALLCRRHHRAVHEEGYQVDRQADGALRFRRPDGRLLPDVPVPPAVPADPVQALRAQLHAKTTCPSWLGERLDVGWAIDVLHPLASRGGGTVDTSEREVVPISRLLVDDEGLGTRPASSAVRAIARDGALAYHRRHDRAHSPGRRPWRSRCDRCTHRSAWRS